MTPPSSTGDCVGVLLAAGRGRRLGGSKQLLIWPPTGKLLVASAFDAISPACSRMLVVLGHEPRAVETALRPRRFETVLSDPDGPMFESVRAGLRAASLLQGISWIILQPADHPGVGAVTLQRLVQEATARPGLAVIPEYAGKGGHPAVIPVLLVPEILAYTGPGGLREFWRSHPNRRVRLDVDDPSVVRDVDTPDDLGADHPAPRSGRERA